MTQLVNAGKVGRAGLRVGKYVSRLGRAGDHLLSKKQNLSPLNMLTIGYGI